MHTELNQYHANSFVKKKSDKVVLPDIAANARNTHVTSQAVHTRSNGVSGHSTSIVFVSKKPL